MSVSEWCMSGVLVSECVGRWVSECVSESLWVGG